MSEFIRPGSAVGIIGGGVAGYRLARTAAAMGMRTVVLASHAQDLALTAATVGIVGAVNDRADLARVTAASNVVTFANENVDADRLASMTTARQLPSGTDILAVTQDRYLEKVFLDDLNLNILPYAQVIAEADIQKAIESVGFPALLKPIQKGIGVDHQLLLTGPADARRAAYLIQQRPYVLEAWLDAPTEFAVAVATDGEVVRVMPVVQTQFERHALKAAIVPATRHAAVVQEITRTATIIAKHLNYRGVFGVEFFMTRSGTLYVKRLTPGVQLNAAILAATTAISAEEMHWRALLGWPLPEVPFLQAGVLIPLREGDRQQAMTQVQIKPDWQFTFYPGAAELIGQMVVFGDHKQAQAALAATAYFNIK